MLEMLMVAVASAALSAQPYTIDGGTSRDDLLATPAPYPAGRVDSPHRAENGRLWVSRSPVGSRTPMRERVHGGPGAGAYGASADENDRVIYTRVGHQVIAIDPFATYDNRATRRYREAANQWLRENGYVLSVRTHVNPMHFRQDAERGAGELPQPRATIRINPAPKRSAPTEMRAGADAPTRIFLPMHAGYNGPAISYEVYAAARDAQADTVAADTTDEPVETVADAEAAD